MGERAPRPGIILIHERKSSVNFLYGFLAVAFAFALVRGHLGAETTAGRVTIDLVMGGLLVGTIGVWVISRRKPSRLEISEDEIVFTHKGGNRDVRLERSWGDLEIRMQGGRYPRPYLCTTGADMGLLLTTFDHGEVRRACEAKGWRFVR